MSAKKKPVSTPLHLLQQLSSSLLEHLENACSQALIDAEKLLAKLEKQRGKTQDKLLGSRAKLQDAIGAGKLKAQAKAKLAVGELETLLEALQDRQAETRGYIAQLKQDAEESLRLAQGIGKVREATAKALSAREAKVSTSRNPAGKAPTREASKPAATKTLKAPPKPVVNRAKPPAAASDKAAAKPASRTRPTKAAATNDAAKPAASAKPARTGAVKPASRPASAGSTAKATAKPGAPKPTAPKPVAPKPAARKAPTRSKPAAAPASPAAAPAEGQGSASAGSNGSTPPTTA